jgi:hypothetical protein
LMGALNYIAYAITAALFLSLAAALYVEYSRASEEHNFISGARELAARISALGGQDPGSVTYYEMRIPQWCELRFEDNKLIVTIGSTAENLETGVAVTGPTLRGTAVSLRLERMENRVEVRA